MKRVLVTLVVLTVAGCAALPPAPAPHTPPPEPSPTSVPVVDPNVPHPFLDLTCADLVPSTVVNVSTDEAITARPVAVYRELSWFDQPQGAAVRQLGGFTCEWSNGAPEEDDNLNPDYSGIYVSVLPGATDEWPKFSPYTNGGPSAAHCGTDAYAQTCTFDALDGTERRNPDLEGVA